MLQLSASLCGLNIAFPWRDGFSPRSTPTFCVPVLLPEQQPFARHGAARSARSCASRQNISCSWKHWCRQAIRFSRAFLAKAGYSDFHSAITTAGRGEAGARTTENLFTMMDAVREAGKTRQLVSVPLLSCEISTGALARGLIAQGMQLLCPALAPKCPIIIDYNLL